jgi:hypothetical protein
LAVIRSAKDEFLALMIEVELKIDESLDWLLPGGDDIGEVQTKNEGQISRKRDW